MNHEEMLDYAQFGVSLYEEEMFLEKKLKEKNPPGTPEILDYFEEMEGYIDLFSAMLQNFPINLILQDFALDNLSRRLILVKKISISKRIAESMSYFDAALDIMNLDKENTSFMPGPEYVDEWRRSQQKFDSMEAMEARREQRMKKRLAALKRKQAL